MLKEFHYNKMNTHLRSTLYTTTIHKLTREVLPEEGGVPHSLSSQHRLAKAGHAVHQHPAVRLPQLDQLTADVLGHVLALHVHSVARGNVTTLQHLVHCRGGGGGSLLNLNQSTD